MFYLQHWFLPPPPSQVVAAIFHVIAWTTPRVHVAIEAVEPYIPHKEVTALVMPYYTQASEVAMPHVTQVRGPPKIIISPNWSEFDSFGHLTRCCMWTIHKNRQSNWLCVKPPTSSSKINRNYE